MAAFTLKAVLGPFVGDLKQRSRPASRQSQTRHTGVCSQPQYSGPRFSVRQAKTFAFCGRFSVRFEDDSGDDWMMILGGVFEDDFRVLFWAIFQVRHLAVDCVPAYVSGRWEPLLKVFGISGPE